MTVKKLERKLLKQMGRAIEDYNMIQRGDRIMVCVSGGKDSLTLLRLLHLASVRTNNSFEVFSFTLDQKQPGWDDTALRAWMADNHYPYEIYEKDTYSVVLDKTKPGKAYCSMCSRMRRGTIYQYAEQHGFNKVALGHHRDDLITSLLMSICYSGEIRSMPPKMISDDRKNIVVRPLAYCAEEDIAEYAELLNFPIIPCSLCGSQEGRSRQRIKQVIDELTAENPDVPAVMLNALGNIQISQLMDKRQWDFEGLEEKRLDKTSNVIPIQQEPEGACDSSHKGHNDDDNDILSV
ncbi:MAG: tRNA 2-thiocytidine(32) synthetase TtcA [Gammaproteobacteria bacterium]|nr:tRNA 2-thiocytidine(32) synthetase TtcA [Gammaproteobacteria bacterium]